MQDKDVMSDLKEAIENILYKAIPMVKGGSSFNDIYYIDGKSLETLQAEYNIYFVEPNEPQLDIV